MLIYQMVFGIDQGQVRCIFHDDTRASAGIGPNGEYNCFACGAKAHDEVGFIAKYFGVGLDRAQKIKFSLQRLQTYKPTNNPLNQEQFNFLKQQGISDQVIQKHFFQSAVGKLMYRHTWNGFNVGYTWFNSPVLSNHNASSDKYHYDKNNLGGSLTPIDDAIKYPTLIICEGEKDMLTAKSVGIPNAVAKVGGTTSYILPGKYFEGKNIIICYDCDEWGRKGAERDATILIEKYGCKVKVIDLGLQDKEDLNDYFIKYKHTLQEFKDLIMNTPLFVPVPVAPKDRFQNLVDSLSSDELDELDKKIQIKKGELQNG
jgi:DNA primase